MNDKSEKILDLKNGYELVLKGDYNEFRTYTTTSFIMSDSTVKCVDKDGKLNNYIGKPVSIDALLFVRKKGDDWFPNL